MHPLRRVHLELRRPVTYIDATNLTPRERRPYIKIAQMHDCDVEALFFDRPIALCKQRNRKRLRVVPEDVLDRMAARLRPPTLEEGFTKVTVMPDRATNAKPKATTVPETSS